MINKTDYAVVSIKALKNRQIGFAYRIASASAKDSGWRMMYDENEDKFDLANPDKVYACTIKKLLKYFPEIETFISEKKFTVAKNVDGKYVCNKISKDLSEVQNKMTGKKKYNSLISGPGASSVILTANPKDMKHGKEEWEDIVS